jgi:DNA-binding LacI/PurR family transcriptional regulator
VGIDPQSPKALYLQIVEDIQTKILTGQFKTGDLLGSHNQLAREYQVSLITIKRALNELLREGWLYSRVGKGTYVSRTGSSNRSNDADTIGFVLTDFKNPFFTMLMHNIERETFQNGYNLLFSCSSESIEKEENQIQHFRNLGVQGLIIASTEHVNEATPAIRQLHEENFPYVMVSYVADSDIYYVGTDHEKGAYDATSHLIQLGYRRIGYLNGEPGNRLGEVRKQGFGRALTENGLSVSENYLFSFPYKRKDYESGYAVGLSFGAMPGRPEALFAFNDFSALGFQHAVLEQGLKIPEDVAVVGFDDIRDDLRAQVPLTTVHQPVEKIGQHTVNTLIKRIHRKPVRVQTILEPHLVVRVSCGSQIKSKVKSEKCSDK